jgi:hypothetical protein
LLLHFIAWQAVIVTIVDRTLRVEAKKEEEKNTRKKIYKKSIEREQLVMDDFLYKITRLMIINRRIFSQFLFTLPLKARVIVCSAK